MTTEQVWQEDSTPLFFLRPIGIAAGDAMRVMDVAKRLPGDVRWRMTPPGVAADAYLIHRHCIESEAAMSVTTESSLEAALDIPNESSADWINPAGSSKKMSLDDKGWHRGRPVCLLGKQADATGLSIDDIAPLIFPEALVELERGLNRVFDEMTGARMLYAVGMLAWSQRKKWQTHRLHAIESGRLVGVIDPIKWQFSLLAECTVERMMNADIVPMPRAGGFAAEGFHRFQLEAALWELAKRCPEPLLDQMLPTGYLKEPLTHRRATHLKEAALGDHCVAILRALETELLTADELQSRLHLKRASLMRAVTGLALVRAIQPKSRYQGGFFQYFRNLWLSLRRDKLNKSLLGPS